MVKLFEEVRRMVQITNKRAVSINAGVPLHTINRIEKGDDGVKYRHVEKLYMYFYGGKQ